MEPPDCSRETFRSPEFQQKAKVRTKSKEKVCNEQTRGKSGSKLPRIVRTPSKFYKATKSITKLNEKLDDSGDSLPGTLAGTSKIPNAPPNIKKEEIPERLRPSHIPRRKYNKDGSNQNCDLPKKIQGCNQYLPECRNVQRVHLLINPDFCPEEHPQKIPTSIATSRPIPTLGQIYGRINMIDSDRLNDLNYSYPPSDWFLELNTPMNSVASTPPNHVGISNSNNDNSSTVAAPPNRQQEELKKSSAVSNRNENKSVKDSVSVKADNYDVWMMASDLEFPTRDNESGYQTMSQANQSKHSQSEVQSVKVNSTYCLGLVSEATDQLSSTMNEDALDCGTVTSSLLKEQETVVLCRTPDTFTEKIEEGTNISKHESAMKPLQVSQHNKPESTKSYITYPSNFNHASMVHISRIPVPSYTECLSEVLQKTTNFENMEAIESQKSPSSFAETEAEIRDNLSNAPLEEYGVSEDQSSEWCRHPCHSPGNMSYDMISETCTTNWSCRCDDGDDLTYVSSSEYHHPHHNWNWKHELCRKYYEDSRLLDPRDRCKKTQRFKRFPSNRYKLPRTFESWRHRLSFRRICRRRWNHVWKKTAERWATWSRSPARFRKFRVMHYLQRSIIWEDADVQTNILVYSERGTDSAVKEQKSAGIGTIMDMNSLHGVLCQKSDSASGSKTSNNRSKFRHVNLGPSMFPFWYNSKRRSFTLQTSNKGPGTISRFTSFLPIPKQSNMTQMDNCIWTTQLDLGLDACNSAKGIQYDAPSSAPLNVDKSTTLETMSHITMDDQWTETYDLPQSTSDKVTSTLLRCNPYQMGNSPSKEMYSQNYITCHNAETDVRFIPNFEYNTTGTFTSGCDITYYRPLTGTDITHLITESRTQQALYPILRKYNSKINTVIREKSTETQISPTNSINRISTGVSTFSPTFTEKTTSFTQCSPLDHNMMIDKQDCASQVEQSKPLSADTETQMSPDASKSIVSTGVTPSSPTMSEKASRFISACLLLDNYPEPPPCQRVNLSCTAPKIMSISSRTLTDKSLSSTELTPERPQPSSASCLAVAKCSCKSTIAAPCAVMKNADAATHHHVFETRHTSTRGLDSYYETEILLNNLIKKALVGDVSLHSQLSHRSDQSMKNCIYVATGVNTCSNPNSITGGRIDASIQHINSTPRKSDTISDTEYRRTAQVGSSQLISMCMLNQITNSCSTQTETKSDHAPIYKCAEMMTSYCGLARSIQMPTRTSSPDVSENSRRSSEKCACASIHYCNTETNTEYRLMSSFERPTQTSFTTEPQKNLEVTNSPKKMLSSKVEMQNNINHQLMSLSRLIGKKRTSSTINPPMNNAIFSNDFSAEKWLKKSISSEKVCDSVTGLEPCNCNRDDISRNSIVLSSCSKCDVTDNDRVISIEAPPIIFSKDSLADVLPMRKSNDSSSNRQSIQNTAKQNRLMIDKGKSDENLTKDVKESMLQACPEICEAGTESRLQIFSQKSACVLTTQCVLPHPPLCLAHIGDNKHHAECVFVYGEPRCAVHKISADAGVQITSSSDIETKKRRERKNHSVGMLTSYYSIDSKTRNPSSLSREVISPKVYKALYETTKLVVNDTNQAPIKESVITRVDAEVEAAKLHVPNVRSAGVVTSTGRGFGYQRCYCRDKGTHTCNKCALYHVTRAVDTTEISKLPTRAKLLQMPEERKPGYCEDCMKTHLVTSCRYYSSLLTKQLGRVKENLTKHIAQPIEDVPQIEFGANTETFTMKPSGKGELGSQTIKYKHFCKLPKQISCTVLTPATSLTDICKHDKDHLKSVYYMISAIEGRLRRLKVSHTKKD